jgi:hypothetical protein
VRAKRVFLLTVTCLCSGFVVSGCSDFKREMGLSPSAPDEFAVESRAPLTIPPEFDLRPPQPGASRPQEVSAAERARKAIENAGPGEPGQQADASGPPRSGSGGQTASADQAGADNSLSNKLLGSRDTGAAAVENRATTVMKDVY